MRNVAIINGSGAYRRLFTEALGMALVASYKEADLVVFTGGEDVTPALYGAAAHPATYNSVQRDEEEAVVFEYCRSHGIPMVGICRGGQFLNVMSGGEMYQHVNKHAIHGTHIAVDVDSGETIPVSSTHHQMMKPSEYAQVVAIATLGGWREWYEGEVFKRDESNTDYEVLFYPDTKSLCFQPHPEFEGDMFEPMKDYFRRCLAKYLEV